MPKLKAVIGALVEAASPKDAVTLLMHDHREVESLFEQYEKAADKRAKSAIVRKICAELELHTRVEEKILYPAIKDDMKELRDTVNEGIVEHAAVKRLIKELGNTRATDEFYAPKVTVLQEFVKHHVKEEETETFPKIKGSDLDLVALGEKIERAKQRAKSR